MYPEEVDAEEPRLQPQELLTLLRADPSQLDRHVFLLQGTSRRLTIHAQQVRALNLVYSLSVQGLIGPDARVAVVGGGFAGVTAALAAAYLGCVVTLVERKPSLLHLQTGSYTRWVHPHIFDWPEAISQKDETDLPFLNWWATTAAEAARLVLDEFQEHRRANAPGKKKSLGDNLRIEYEEAELANTPNKLRVANMHRPYQVIILATGFGTERAVSSDVAFRSYWMCDALHQPNMLAGHPTSEYVISGTGDGGLIDLLRLRVNNFRQDLLVNELFDHHSSDEANAIAALKTSIRSTRRAILREANEQRQVDLLEDGYSELTGTDGFRIVKERLKSRLRPDTLVHLHGRDERYLSPHASVLHTFLAFVLRDLRAFDYYWGGDLKITRNDEGVSVSLPDSGPVKQRKLVPRDTIVRYGPVFDNPDSQIIKVVESYRASLKGGRITGLQHTSRRVVGNTNTWWAQKGVRDMRESVKRRAGVAELKDSRDNARRTSGLLEEAVSLQRSLFVRGAIGEFINGPMYKAFHDLVYSYRDEEWAIVQQRATDRFGVDELALFDLSRDAANRAEAWMLFEEVNHGAEEGKRRYHPAFFQGSEEERRLDQLLEYFNMIGSYWTRGLLKDEDIEPLDSYILFLVDRKAIRYYLEYSGRIWSHRKEIKRREANVPFAHLRRLLERVEAKRAEREG